MVISDAVSQPLPGRDAGEAADLQPQIENSLVIQTGSETTTLCTAMQAKLPADTGDTLEAQEKQGYSGWIQERK